MGMFEDELVLVVAALLLLITATIMFLNDALVINRSATGVKRGANKNWSVPTMHNRTYLQNPSSDCTDPWQPSAIV